MPRRTFADRLLAGHAWAAPAWVLLSSLRDVELRELVLAKLGAISRDGLFGDRVQPVPEASRTPAPLPVADVDLVISWVDGADAAFVAKKARYRAACTAGAATTLGAGGAKRFEDRGELRYLLRSVDRHLPWIRRVHLLCDDQRPAWLNETHPRLVVHDQRDFFVSQAAVPSFNSHAIEMQLHHVPGLAEHFIYCNDDYFFGQDLAASAFFYASGDAGGALAPYVFASDEYVAPVALRQRHPAAHYFAAWNTTRAAVELRAGARPFRFAHAHQAAGLTRTLLRRVEEELPELARRTRMGRFRSRADLVPVGAALGLHAVRCPDAVRPMASRYFTQAAELQRWLDSGEPLPPLFCLSDGDGHDVGSAVDVNSALARAFPEPSAFEKSADTRHAA
jgi:hypothetical protein